MSKKGEKQESGRFFQSLAFKLSLAIFMIASILLSSLGTYYIRKFAAEIDQRLLIEAQIPGRLMNEGVIPQSMARDRALLSSLTGEEVLMAAVAGPDQQILYSLDPKEEGQSAEIYRPYATMRDAETLESGAVAVRWREKMHGFFYVSVPLTGGEGQGGYLHLKMNAANAGASRQRVAQGFLFGFILCIFLISAVCAILVHWLTVPRLRGITNSLKVVEGGDLSPPTPLKQSQDELGVLGRNVAQMINELAQRKEEREQLGAEILAAKVDAEKSSRSKNEFLANMSHEIRTPMNGVLGMAQLMKDTELSSEQREYIETISASADNLLKIINNILDLSRIEMGKFNLNIDAVSVPLVLNELHTFFTPAVLEKGLELKVDCPADLPLIRTDEGSLRQVLINLMANAVKFTQKGHVEVEVKCLEKTGNECTLEFRISDTGIGISKEAQDIIFHEFTQADGSHTREFGGTGLGLAISKKMVEQLGGRLSVSSEPGKGSAFSFTISVNMEEIPQEGPACDLTGEESGALDLEVLLVEDNTLNQRVAVKMLEKMGCRVEVAGNGREAMSKLKLTSPEESRPRYDIILMDIQMPVLDGLKATAMIRAQEGDERRTPIIAMTAHAMKGDREKFLDEGMDGYLSKPVRREDLRNALKQYG